MGAENISTDMGLAALVGFVVGFVVGAVCVKYKVNVPCKKVKVNHTRLTVEDEEILELVHELAQVYENTDKYLRE